MKKGEMRSPRVTILRACPARNRQAEDVSVALEKRGAIVRTLTSWDCSEDPGRRCGIAERVLSRIPHGRGVGRAVDFAGEIGLVATDLLVCVNYPALLAAVPLALFRRPGVVYYCLETVKDKPGAAMEAGVCRLLSAVVLVPEENRARSLQARLGARCSMHVVPNVPHLTPKVARQGRLRSYVAVRIPHGDPTIVLYAGSYQPYAHLEEIVRGSAAWPAGTYLALMLVGPYPDTLRAAVQESQSRTIIVPPVGTGELYSWIADADIGLLPYEDEYDINVRYCAPQKVFDYLACGIPFIGSRRPSIEAISEEVGCGVCIDMTDGAALAEAVEALHVNRARRGAMAARARKAHSDKYHYDKYFDQVWRALLPPELCAEALGDQPHPHSCPLWAVGDDSVYRRRP